MARAAAEDFLSQNNFFLFDLPTVNVPSVFPFQSGRSILRGDLETALAFTAVTLPSITMEPVVIREGNWPFERKVGTRASIAPVSLQCGVLPEDNDFAIFFFGYLFGPVAFRRDLVLIHTYADKSPARAYILADAIPSRVKLDGDFQASSGEVSIAELDLEVGLLLPASLSAVSI